MQIKLFVSKHKLKCFFNAALVSCFEKLVSSVRSQIMFAFTGEGRRFQYSHYEMRSALDFENKVSLHLYNVRLIQKSMSEGVKLAE